MAFGLKDEPQILLSYEGRERLTTHSAGQQDVLLLFALRRLAHDEGWLLRTRELSLLASSCLVPLGALVPSSIFSTTRPSIPHLSPLLHLQSSLSPGSLSGAFTRRQHRLPHRRQGRMDRPSPTLLGSGWPHPDHGDEQDGTERGHPGCSFRRGAGAAVFVGAARSSPGVALDQADFQLSSTDNKNWSSKGDVMYWVRSLSLDCFSSPGR